MELLVDQFGDIVQQVLRVPLWPPDLFEQVLDAVKASVRMVADGANIVELKFPCDVLMRDSTGASPGMDPFSVIGFSNGSSGGRLFETSGKYSIEPPRLGSAVAGTAREGSVRGGAARVGSIRIGAVRVGSVRVDTARVGSERVGAARVGSIRIGAVGVGSLRVGAMKVGSVRVDAARAGAVRVGSGNWKSTVETR